jgi:RNA polymerase sigma factor (sigma-70 family)
MRGTPDTALVRAAQGGDERALAAVAAGAMPLVYNVVGKALGGGPDVDDVVQETMLRVVRGIGGLRDPERFRAWVISIAYRQMQDRERALRAAAALGPLVEDAAQWPDPVGDVVDSAMFRLHLAGERREAAEAGRWLSVDDQQVLRLWWQEVAGRLTRAELARQLGLSAAHAAVRVQRTKAQFAVARTLWRAWHARPRCPQLAAAAANLDGPSDPRWLKRLSRHVRRCEACGAYEAGLIPAEHLITGANVAPVLAALGGVAATGKAAAPAFWLWDLLQRGFRYVAAHALPASAVAAVGATTAIVYAVLYQPYDGGAEVAAPPPAASPSTPAAAPTAAPASPTPPTRAPGGGFAGVATADYYVAPDGSDANPGSLDRPFGTVGKAASVVRPGQTIALRAGVHRPTRPVEITRSGSAGARIVLSNYRDERPVIDAAGLPAGASYVTHRASYWTVQGLEVRRAPGHAYLCVSCRDNVFRALSIHDNGRTGLLLRDRGTSDNLVVDSDFFANHDAGTHGEFADGLGIEYGAGQGNAVRGCRLYGNADDGLGLHEFASPVTIETTWSFGNGINRWRFDPFDGDGYGFKLGGGVPAPPVAHVITGSAAWDNAGYGFTESGNAGALVVRNNTAFRNGKTGFAFEMSVATLRQNLAVDNARDVQLGGGVAAADNSWNQTGWTGSAVLTGDSTSALAPRAPDGGLPRTAFLTNTRNPRIGASMTPG